MFEDVTHVPRRRAGVGKVDAGTAARAPVDGDQTLVLEHPKCFAKRRPRDPELLHEIVLGRKRVPLAKLTTHDLAPKMVGDELAGLGDPYVNSHRAPRSISVIFWHRCGHRDLPVYVVESVN